MPERGTLRGILILPSPLCGDGEGPIACRGHGSKLTSTLTGNSSRTWGSCRLTYLDSPGFTVSESAGWVCIPQGAACAGQRGRISQLPYVWANQTPDGHPTNDSHDLIRSCSSLGLQAVHACGYVVPDHNCVARHERTHIAYRTRNQTSLKRASCFIMPCTRSRWRPRR